MCAMKTTQIHEQKALTSSQTATLQVARGGKIQSLGLLFLTGAGAPVTEAQIRAEIGNIRLTLNGRDVVNASAVQLLDLYEALGNKVGTPAGVAGTLELNVGRLVYDSPDARDLFGFGTNDISTIQVQVTAGTLSAIASVVAISARTPEVENLGAHCEFISYPQSFNSTGDHTVDTLPRNMDSSYLAVMIDDGASGTITFGECRVNNQTIRERLSSAMNNQFCSNAGYVQPSGYFSHFFADGSVAGRLPMPGVVDLRFITTFSVAPGAAGYNIGALTMVTPGAAV